LSEWFVFMEALFEGQNWQSLITVEEDHHQGKYRWWVEITSLVRRFLLAAGFKWKGNNCTFSTKTRELPFSLSSS